MVRDCPPASERACDGEKFYTAWEEVVGWMNLSLVENRLTCTLGYYPNY